MLKISRSIILNQSIQVRMCHSNKSFVDVVTTVQNVHEKNPYKFESNMKPILKTLRTLLSCTERKAYSIWDQYPSIRSDDMMKKVGNNIGILMKWGISSEIILENPFLIVMNGGLDHRNLSATTLTTIIISKLISIVEIMFYSLQFSDDLQSKLNILLEFNLSKKTINDFAPLVQIKEPYLRQIFELFAQEQNQIPHGNRIYHFSRKLNVCIDFLYIECFVVTSPILVTI